MEAWKIISVIAVILVLLGCLLYYFGIGFTSRACVSVFRANYSVPTRWEGKFLDTTGYVRRNFVIFKKYSKLLVEVETTSGTLDFKAKGPDGSILSPSSGVYGWNTSVLIDVSQIKRCSVMLKMDHFNGNFHIALQ